MLKSTYNLTFDRGRREEIMSKKKKIVEKTKKSWTKLAQAVNQFSNKMGRK